jgi:hypothetical protein
MRNFTTASYWSLGKFLRLGGEQRLRKCPVCLRYFIQPTARLQTHCGDACRLKSDPNRREANAEYQRRHRGTLREMLIQKDLKKVKEAKVSTIIEKGPLTMLETSPPAVMTPVRARVFSATRPSASPAADTMPPCYGSRHGDAAGGPGWPWRCW